MTAAVRAESVAYRYPQNNHGLRHASLSVEPGDRLPLQLSGHSGVFWMAIIIVAAGVVPKRGAASLVGLTSGIMAGFFAYLAEKR